MLRMHTLADCIFFIVCSAYTKVPITGGTVAIKCWKYLGEVNTYINDAADRCTTAGGHLPFVANDAEMDALRAWSKT